MILVDNPDSGVSIIYRDSEGDKTLIGEKDSLDDLFNEEGDLNLE